jgi:ABC-type glycerol-3-phosphate transport system permease component
MRTNPPRFTKDQIPIYLYLIPIAFFMAVPIVFIILHAFKPADELFAFPPRFFVTNPTFENFWALFGNARGAIVPISRYLFNTLIVTIAVVFLIVFISTLAGFSLSKMRFRLNKAFFTVNNLALMFVPVAVTIPRYLTIDAIGIRDTYLAHILPLLAMPVGVFLIKQFIDQVPDSLVEAAVVDGAGAFTVYRVVILPLIRPAVATCAILAFQLVWNNLETSALFADTENIRTLAFYMSTLAAANSIAGQGMAAAAGLVMFIPNLILFIILQSNVMNTMAHSGLK